MAMTAIDDAQFCGGYLAVVRRWLARSWAMGRDGILSGTGGAGGSAINSATGAVETGPMSFALPVPGYGPLKMAMAWDAITNLCPALASTPGLASNTLDSATLKRTLVEDTSTGNHYGAGTQTLATSTLYRLAFRVARGVGSRHAIVYANKTSRAGIAVNLDTGAVANVTAGTGAVANASAVLRPDGFWYCEATVSATADWGAATTILAGTSNDGTSLSSHTGDGSSLIYQGVTLTPLTDYAPLLAEGISRTADSHIWTSPAALPQDAEITHLLWQPYADGDMGIANQTWLRGYSSPIYPLLFRSAATTLRADDADTASATATSTTIRTLPKRGILAVQRVVRKMASVAAGYGSAVGTPVAIPGANPWFGQTDFRVGWGASAGRASRAGNGVVITPGGCTQAEREAVARLFHLKSYPVAA